MKKLSIKTSIALPAVLILTAGITIMAVITGMLSASTADSLTNELIETKVAEHVNSFQSLCSEVYGATAAITPIVAKYIDPDFTRNISDSRGEVMDILSKVLLNNEKIIAIWTCWEPNAFDGKDHEYAGRDFYDQTGRFVPYLYKDGATYRIEALADYEDPVNGLYYQGARDSGKPYITDPYDYQVGGTVIPICSLAIPILQNGKTAGVVGVDIDLQDFMDLMNSTGILEDGYMFTLSPGGLLASHINKDMQMQSYRNTWLENYGSEVENILKHGGSMKAETYSDVIGADIVLIGHSAVIGDTGRYWLICGVVPQQTVNASSVSLITMIIITGTLLAMVVALTIVFLVHRNLKKLPMLKAAADAIAAGDIRAGQMTIVSGATKNEIDLLEQAFCKMAEGIQKQAEIMSRLAEGDYTVTVPLRSEQDVIGGAIRNMLDTSKKTLVQINSVAGQVSAGAKQIADNAQLLAVGAAEQAASVEELSASLNDISLKTNENAKIAGEAAALSDSIIEKVKKGGEQMERMMLAVNDINAASTRIESIIKAIDDIAFQTNILALNAAVEAARAGMHGKGFAVVAEEVRSLAAKSAESASATGAMIDDAKEKANLGLAIADETACSLREIIDSVNSSTKIIAAIRLATDEQAGAISQINAGIGQVSQIVQQNSAASEESATSSEQMSGQAEQLSQLISQFKL